MSKRTKKYVAIALCVFLLTSTVIAVNLTSGSGSFAAAASNKYIDAFKEQYDKIHNSGYFSQEGVPYHSIETLMVEAPDYGHETTSEAFSYYVWLEAMNGNITGDWTGFTKAWDILEKYAIPSEKDQPNMSGYNPQKCAGFVPGGDDASDYPMKLNLDAPCGADPLDSQLKSAYNTNTMYVMHWIYDVDNWYGFGNHGDGTSRVSQINTYNRGEQESCWETVDFPSWEMFKWGNTSKGGFQSLFVAQDTYSKQWRYSVASDADTRAIQATYWANKWAKAQGKSVSDQDKKAAKLGDYLRYVMFDKFFKPIGSATVNGPGGTGYDSCHYLVSWYCCWGAPASAENWAWKQGSSASHQGYQNPLAAYALANTPELKPLSSNGAADWGKSLDRQLEFLQWLQSSEGAIAGGCNNSIGDRYVTAPADASKFYGMVYDPDPVWHDPPSNRWFGFQVWGLQRLAEYYYETGDTKAKAILDKWVKWAVSQTKFENGGFQIPSDMSWTGQPDTWNKTYTGNPNLHVKVDTWCTDLGPAASYANLLTYYAAKSGDTAARDTAQKLLDIMLGKYKDTKGIAVKESRSDYKRFFTQEVYIPSGWTGTNPQGASIKSGVKFIDIRPKYKEDPSWAALQAAYSAGKDFEITYHRFWAQCEIAVALATFGLLFADVVPSTSPSTSVSPTSELERCDLNKDGAVNMGDVMLIAGSFNTKTGDAWYVAYYDINVDGGDGAINMADVMLIAKYFNKRI